MLALAEFRSASTAPHRQGSQARFMGSQVNIVVEGQKILYIENQQGGAWVYWSLLLLLRYTWFLHSDTYTNKNLFAWGSPADKCILFWMRSTTHSESVGHAGELRINICRWGIKIPQCFLKWLLFSAKCIATALGLLTKQNHDVQGEGLLANKTKLCKYESNFIPL